MEQLDGSEDLEDLKGEAGICLYNIGWHREAYSIVKECVHKNDVCTYVAAECLSQFGEYSRSLELFKSLIESNNHAGESTYQEYFRA